jgi:hypothetical protein
MDELFILMLPRRLRHNCAVDARATSESAQFHPAIQVDTTPGAPVVRRNIAATVPASPTADDTGGRNRAPSTGGRSHPGGEKPRANAYTIPAWRRESDFFEAIAMPEAVRGQAGEFPRRCLRRPIEIRAFTPLRPTTLHGILRGLTPVLRRVKQPSHSRSSGPHRNRRAGRIGRFPAARRGYAGPPRGTVIRPWQREVRGPARECR